MPDNLSLEVWVCLYLRLVDQFKCVHVVLEAPSHPLAGNNNNHFKMLHTCINTKLNRMWPTVSFLKILYVHYLTRTQVSFRKVSNVVTIWLFHQSLVCISAMSGLEPKASFNERALEIGATEALVTSLTGAGIDCFGKLAFACSANPHSGDGSPLREAVTALLGAEPSVAEMMVIRRLWFEASGFALADLKSKTDKTPGEGVKSMPLAEGEWEHRNSMGDSDLTKHWHRRKQTRNKVQCLSNLLLPLLHLLIVSV